jgi:hypothetical protein
MKDFTFHAPTLFDALAMPAIEDELHDAPGAAGPLARTKRFAAWLKSEISDKGMLAFGPSIDETGWIIVVHPVGGGHVYALASEVDGHEGLFSLIVWELGNATKDVGEAIESILRDANEITQLQAT